MRADRDEPISNFKFAVSVGHTAGRYVRYVCMLCNTYIALTVQCTTVMESS